jgi:hypothetical protein
LWFFWLGTLMLGGAIVGSFAASGATDAAAAMEASRIAGEEFGIRHSGIILIGSLLLAIAGTWLGFLPGTRKKVN